MQDLVSERDQSWVTCDAILHTLIIPQFGKNATCALHVLFNQQRSFRFHCVYFALCGVTIAWELLSLSKDNKPHRWHNG